ncbi:amidohydrolase family protein [Aquiflexum sp.]|uniref:amidohydrolase family protein n=1 Tax=Aquiflexum sp. TaxID=1872584 RepID=UPI0035932AC2
MLHLVKNPEELQQLIRNRDRSIINSTGQIDMFKWIDYIIDNFDTSRISVFQEIISRSDTWFCPTLVNLRMWGSNSTAFIEDNKLKYIPGEEHAIWKNPTDLGEFSEDLINHTDWHIDLSLKYYHNVLSLLKPILDSGAKFLAGTDIGNPYLIPGFSLHDELELFVEAGFTPLEALQTATINPALYLNRSAEIGTVEKGKIANLILLDANPQEDIRSTQKIHSVISSGKLYSREKLDKILKEVEENAKEK